MEDSLLNFGLINIDKPSGPTSFSVSDLVRKRLKVSKTSHMGTLDPKVTGVLPITLGRACKLAGFFIAHDKTYVGVLQTHKEQKIEELQKIIDERFVGRIRQTPPHKSAVARVERERTVYSWKLLEASENAKNFLFECKVEGGTYIRKLCSDIGELIGGAHMAELRRVAAGVFTEEKMYTLYEFEKAVDLYRAGDKTPLRTMVMPAEVALQKIMKTVQVSKTLLPKLYTGSPLFEKDMGKRPEIAVGEAFAVFCEDVLVGVYRRGKEAGIFARSEFVKS